MALWSKWSICVCLIPVFLGWAACGGGEDEVEECTSWVILDQDITEDTTLDGCYTVAEPIVVRSATLTIAAGSTLQFEQGVHLSITSGGALIATGTASRPILLTGIYQERGYWRYLIITGSAAPTSQLDWVVMEYAGSDGYDPANLVVEDGAAIAVTHSIFRQSEGFGIKIDNGANVGAFAANTLTQNAQGAASVGADSAGFLDAESDYTGNDTDLVLLRDGGNYNVRREQTWPGINVPYLLDDTISVQAHLTIAAGAEVRVRQDQSITVIGSAGGSLTAVGTEASPILLTGEQNTRGFWKFLRLSNADSENNRLEHVIVEYAGEDDYQPGNFVVEDGSRVAIRNCTFHESSGFGLVIENGAIVTEFAANTMTENQLGAAQVGADSAGYLDETSDYSGNDVDIVLLTDGGNHNVRRDQTWPGINVDYVLDDTIAVNAHLTVAAGAVVRVKNNQWISLTGSEGGGLTAVGTAERPILFSRESTSTGNWAGIVFSNSANAGNALEYVTVEYGGANLNPNPANVKLDAGTTVDIRHSTFRHSAADGIWVNCNVTVNDLAADDNTFEDNAGLDLNIKTNC